MIPNGPTPKPAFTRGFFKVAEVQNPKPETIALAYADAEFGQNACEGARENAKDAGFKIVYDKSYPPATIDFTPIVRAIQARNPDLLVICSYPLDSVGMIKTINEIGFKPKMWGGAMVGLQSPRSRPNSARCSTASSISKPGCRSSRWNFPDRWSF